MPNVDDAKSWIDLIQSLDGVNINVMMYLTLVIVVVCTYVTIEIVNLTTKKHVFNYVRVLLQSSVSLGVGMLSMIILRGKLLPISIIVSIVVGIVLYTKWIKDFVDSIGERKKSYNSESLDLSTDLLDILLDHGYISTNQLSRLVSDNILDSPDTMVNELLVMNALTNDELVEVKVISNLSRLMKRSVSRDEAKEYIRTHNL